ncbi:MAG: hypothetical protein WC806_00925 [Candidatus Gracilibacteria bacterium]|jgi:hypothetical protein
MNDYKIIFGVLSVLIALIGYAFYIRMLLIGKIKPHIFAWIIWGFETALVFVAQLLSDGGSGAWITGAISLVCFFIGYLAFIKKGEKKFLKTDWVFFSFALLALVIWIITKEPLYSVMLMVISDSIATLLTMKNSYRKPFEESALMFFMSTIAFIFSIFAIDVYILTNWLFPVAVVFFNLVVVLWLLIRRYQLKPF